MSNVRIGWTSLIGRFLSALHVDKQIPYVAASLGCRRSSGLIEIGAIVKQLSFFGYMTDCCGIFYLHGVLQAARSGQGS